MSEAEIEWSRMTAAEVNALAKQDAIVLLPVASTEQHGPHLPTGCDTILTSEIVLRTARLVQEERPVIVAPAVWTGLAQHHVAFGGTFTISFATYHALLRDIVQSIRDVGFSKLLIVNGHGGNIAALSVLTEELTRETGLRVATTTYPVLPQQSGDYDGILEDQPYLQHACEAETSMLMALGQGYVREDKLKDAYQEGYQKGDSSPLSHPILLWSSFKDFTASGVRGDARRASVEKGEKYLDATCGRLAAALLAGEPWDR